MDVTSNHLLEILELRYGDVSYNETREEEGQELVFPNLSNETSEVTAEVEPPPAFVRSFTWSHQINLAVEEGVTLKVRDEVKQSQTGKQMFQNIRYKIFNR